MQKKYVEINFGWVWPLWGIHQCLPLEIFVHNFSLNYYMGVEPPLFFSNSKESILNFPNSLCDI